MSNRILIGGLVLSCALTAGGVQLREENLIFFDNKGDLKLYATSVLGNVVPGESLSFDLTGDPVVGVSKVQSLEFRSLHAKVDAADAGNGSFKLSAATLDGNVVVKMVGGTEDAKSVSTIETQLLHFVENEAAIITLPEKFVYKNVLTKEESVRTVFMAGASGTIRMFPLDQAAEHSNPVVSADVQGPLRAEMTTDFTDAAKTDSTVVLTGDRLTYVAEKNALRVEGNVTVVSTQTPPDGEPLTFTIRPPWVDVLLDDDFQVISFTVGGGTGSMSGKGGGG